MSISIGLDIAKEKMDVYVDGHYYQISNKAEAIKEHFSSYEDKSAKVVMEATGKYHRQSHKILEELGFSVMVINPYQSKHFAKALNLICKTDKVDAKMLSMFGERMEFKVTESLSTQQEKLQELSKHLDDLMKTKHGYHVRHQESSGSIKESLKKILEALNKEIKDTENKLKEIITKDEILNKKLNLLVSIPGIGEKTAIVLLCYLKELGTLSKRKISALAGLAPVNNDSGKFSGKRRIKGGRHDVRSNLHMPILGAATQHNNRLNIFYNHLVGAGKPKKVALTACMRKMVVWANAILTTGESWNDNYESNG